MPTLAITAAEIFAGLQYAEGNRWTTTTVTYSIPGEGAVFSAYGPTAEPANADYGVLNAAQRIGFIEALGAWEKLIALDLVEVADGATQGTIRVAFTDVNDFSGASTAAYAYTPPPTGFRIEGRNGDIWVDETYKAVNPLPGTFLYETLLHEIGHALGLKHPFEGTQLPVAFNNTRYTVMAYNEFTDSAVVVFTPGDFSLRTTREIPNTLSPMLLDVIAIQGLYGASNAANLGADTYTFDLGTLAAPRAFLMTIVDNGGVDTLDLSAHTRPSFVDLTPESYSSIGFFSIQAQIAAWSPLVAPAFIPSVTEQLNRASTHTWSNNVALGPNTIIEIVRAGAGSDTVIGNIANNLVDGGAGDDTVSGGLGDDTINGGAGNDTLDGGAAGPAGNYLRGDGGDDSLFGGAGFDDVNGNMGSDTVSTGAGQDFCVGGQGNDRLFGGADYDLVYGNLGDDSCSGDDGDDVVRGGQGNDSLAGGAGADYVSGDRGDDTVSGGLGADDFHSFAGAGIDRVLDFSAAEGDRVRLDPGTMFVVMQWGGDTVVMVSDGMIILAGVQMSTLTPGSIFVG